MVWTSKSEWWPWGAISVITWIPLAILYISRVDRIPGLGGLYFVIINQILSGSFVPPTRIPYYSLSGIPFAYPPLQFYILAILKFVGFPLISLAEYGPPLLVGGMTAAWFLFVQRSVNDGIAATVSTVAFIAIYGIKGNFLFTDALVQTPAAMFAIIGLAVAIPAFQERPTRQRVLISGGLFGLALLSHPWMAFLFALGGIALFLDNSPSADTLRTGLQIAGVAFLIFSPWAIYTISTHSFNIWLDVARMPVGVDTTYSSSLNVVRGLASFAIPGVVISRIGIDTTLMIGGLIGLYLQIRDSHWFGLFWILLLFGVPLSFYQSLAMVYTFGSAGAMVVRQLSVDVQQYTPEVVSLRDIQTMMTIVFILLTLVSAAGSVGGETPAPVTSSEEKGFKYIQNNAPESAVIAPLTDTRTAEWAPYYTQRTYPAAYWGVEWEGRETFWNHYRWTQQVSQCRTPTCIKSIYSEIGVDPNRPVYVIISGEPDVVNSFSRRGWVIKWHSKSVYILARS